MNILLTLGSVAAVATAPVQTSAALAQEQLSTEKVESGLFSGNYDLTEKGFLQFISESNNVFSDINYSLTSAKEFFQVHEDKALNILDRANSELNQRGFFSFLGGIFKTIGTSVAAAVTFGQVPAITDAVIDSAQQVANNAESAGKAIYNAASIGLNAASILEGNGEGAAAVAEGIEGIVDNA